MRFPDVGTGTHGEGGPVPAQRGGRHSRGHRASGYGTPTGDSDNHALLRDAARWTRAESRNLNRVVRGWASVGTPHPANECPKPYDDRAVQRASLSKKGATVTCSIEDCTNPRDARGWCATHYARWRRHGDPLKLLINERGTGHIAPNGYRTVSAPGHPVSFAAGVALEHRVVFFNAHGIGPFLCYWCSSPIHWLRPLADDGLVVDHLDGDKINNKASNLVASCNVCNMLRGQGRLRRTHCARGHEFTDENTYVSRDGKRKCRACEAMRKRRYRRERKAA